MHLTFSQKWAKKYDKEIRRIINIVKTTSLKRVWIKIFFYKHRVDYNGKMYATHKSGGHYRGAYHGHGFYDKEWSFMRKHNIQHCITLKLNENMTDTRLASLIAHEFRHFRQYETDLPKQIERDAKKWTEKRIERLKTNGLLKDEYIFDRIPPDKCAHLSYQKKDGIWVCSYCNNKIPMHEVNIICHDCKDIIGKREEKLETKQLFSICENCKKIRDNKQSTKEGE